MGWGELCFLFPPTSKLFLAMHRICFYKNLVVYHHWMLLALAEANNEEL